MTLLDKKKLTQKNKLRETQVIDNVFPLNQSHRRADLKENFIAEEPEIDFSRLANKLEERIGRIEIELKNSMSHLEDDINQFIKSNNGIKDEAALKNEIDSLAKALEDRFTKTLSLLGKTKFNRKVDNDNLEAVRNISTQLVKILSFDFYKNVLGNLGRSHEEAEIDPFGMDHNLVKSIRPLFDFLYYRYWRVHTTGIENIPNDGRALIVANHSGTLPYDGAMIKTAIINEHPKRKDARFLVEDFVYHMPMLGTFMYRIGGVRASPENAERLLNAGHLVIVFPEGVKGIGKLFNQRYKLQRFGRGGFIKLCMNTKSPLVPVSVVGAEEIHPILFKSNILAKMIGVPYMPITPTFPLLGLLGCVPLPTKWSIHFGKPISFGQYGPEALDDDLLIHKLSEDIRLNIQEMIVELLKKRRSVWSG